MDKSKDIQDEKENTDATATPLDTILDELPEDARPEVKSIMLSLFRAGGVVSPQIELSQKLTPENIDHFIDADDRESERQYKSALQTKIVRLIALMILAGFLLVVIVLLRNQPDILDNVLCTAGGLIAGIIGGYGYGKNKRDD